MFDLVRLKIKINQSITKEESNLLKMQIFSRVMNGIQKTLFNFPNSIILHLWKTTTN